MKHKTGILIFLCLLCPGLIHAQDAVSGSGGDATGSGGTASYTLGQIAYSILSGAGGKVSQGVQQPYEVRVLGGIEEGISLQYKIFPNPTHDYVTLRIENILIGNLMYRLFDLNGKILQDHKIENGETPIGLGGYDASVYLLKVTDDFKELKTFLIIKK
ncbi:MAG TPA: T9SS type A sorting domain-containing protein [Cyclobacteriaceae bacterium]|nr:T9SS type A sorting domain-containing protein [Cyclobacteriaceae bacterium]